MIQGKEVPSERRIDILTYLAANKIELPVTVLQYAFWDVVLKDELGEPGRGAKVRRSWV